MTDLNQLPIAPDPTTTTTCCSLLNYPLKTPPQLYPLLFTQLLSTPDPPRQCPSSLIFVSVLAELPLPYGLIHSVGEVVGTEEVAFRRV